MKYPLTDKYDISLQQAKIMGPNPLKLTEELLCANKIPKGALVMDLGSGSGLTSVFLAKEYGYKVVAADLWSDPTENRQFFNEMGLSEQQIIPIKADAAALPFAHETFDGVVCTDSYNYFGRDKAYFNEKLLSYVKRGGYIYIAIPGMKKDMHENLPKELLLSWSPEQMDYIHDVDYWKDIFSLTKGAVVETIEPMAGNEELWADWIKCDNDYARGDKKAIDAGGLKYLNFIKIVIHKD